jgi:chorismate mutase
MSLKKIRNDIDEIDEKIIFLLSDRINLIYEVGEIKKLNKIKIYDKNREKEVFENVKRLSKLKKIPIKTIMNIYKIILKESKNIQNDKK